MFIIVNVGAGVRQDDHLLPTLFSLFINDLVLEIKQTDNYDVIEDKMLAQIITLWQQEVHAKPKLRT